MSMIGMILLHNQLIPFDKKKKNKFDIKKKEEEIICSLFEVEKFLCCCHTAKEYSELAKFIRKHFRY